MAKSMVIWKCLMIGIDIIQLNETGIHRYMLVRKKGKREGSKGEGRGRNGKGRRRKRGEGGKFYKHQNDV